MSFAGVSALPTSLLTLISVTPTQRQVRPAGRASEPIR